MDKFLIGPIKGGTKTDLVPFFIPEDAFTLLLNLVVKDGKIQKCPISSSLDDTSPYALTSRLRVNIGTTDIAGALPATIVPTGGNQLLGQQFSVDDDIFTVQLVNGAMVTPSAADGTYDTVTGTVTINNTTPNTVVYWYPTYAVLGFANYTDNIGDTIGFAFDNKFAYKWNNPNWERVINVGAPVWSVDTTRNDKRFISCQYRARRTAESYLFVTNFKDPIRYYDPTLDGFVTPTINFLAPASNDVVTCRYIIEFEGRLLLLNTIEHEGGIAEISHPNRIRFSEYGKVFNVDSWYQDPQASDKGGNADLPAGEIIVCAEILDGRLIVFCESSIYELVSTGNYREPFQIVLIDDTFGTYSANVVEIDNRLLFTSITGINVYDGRNVIKISDDLDDTFASYDYRNAYVYKDVDSELIFIFATGSTINPPKPFNQNRILIYNYKNNTFSRSVDSLTAIGVSYKVFGARSLLPIAFVGNQHGYTFYMTDDYQERAISVHISVVTRFDANNLWLIVHNHSVEANDAIHISGSALAGLNGQYIVREIPGENLIRITNNVVVAGNYEGDAVFSIIPRTIFITKAFNFYMKDGRGTAVNKVAFNVDKTAINGKYTLIARPGSSVEATVPAFYLGERTLETAATALIPAEANQTLIWRDVYVQASSDSVAFEFTNVFYLTEADTPFQPLVINAIIIYAEPSGII